jgi:phage gp36-like protein
MFASLADLLARSNARRLFQLAVPADRRMPTDDAMRAAMGGGDLTIYGIEVAETLGLALAAMRGALADAQALMVGYGVPLTASGPLVARLCSTVALYYLQGAERMTDDVRRAYESAMGTLKDYARGEVELMPPAPGAAPVDDEILIESGPGRYGLALPMGSDW